MGLEAIKYSEAGAVAAICLHRPERLNSCTEQMHIELAEVLDRIKNNTSLRCLVLTGSGRGFCGGQDLSARILP